MKNRADLRAAAQSKKLEESSRQQSNLKVTGMEDDAVDQQDERSIWLRHLLERCGKLVRGGEGRFQTMRGEGVEPEFPDKPKPITQQGRDGLLHRTFQLPSRQTPA